jgi:peptide/nickel transport system permease protein
MLSVYTYKSNWWGFIAKRVLIAILVCFIFTMFVYFFVVNYPFDPNAEAPYILRNLSPEFKEKIQELNQIYHFNDPYVEKYFRWLGDFFTGNWGNSFVKRVPVWDLLF